jgi:hypothetical protein
MTATGSAFAPAAALPDFLPGGAVAFGLACCANKEAQSANGNARPKNLNIVFSHQKRKGEKQSKEYKMFSQTGIEAQILTASMSSAQLFCPLHLL